MKVYRSQVTARMAGIVHVNFVARKSLAAKIGTWEKYQLPRIVLVRILLRFVPRVWLKNLTPHILASPQCTQYSPGVWDYPFNANFLVIY
jgi:hypothetical protein